MLGPQALKITTDYPLITITVLARGEAPPPQKSLGLYYQNLCLPCKNKALEKALEALSLASDANLVYDFWIHWPCRSA